MHDTSNLSSYILSQDSYTAFMAASIYGHESIASMLVAAGASIDIQDKVSTRIGCVY